MGMFGCHDDDRPVSSGDSAETVALRKLIERQEETNRLLKLLIKKLDGDTPNTHVPPGLDVTCTPPEMVIDDSYRERKNPINYVQVPDDTVYLVLGILRLQLAGINNPESNLVKAMEELKACFAEQRAGENP